MFKKSSILVLLMCSLCSGASYADCNNLSVFSGCLCPGRSIVYECAVADSTSQGLTVWKVPRIRNSVCSTEISLSHATNFRNQSGGCVEALANSVLISSGCYISRLTIHNVSTIVAEGGGIDGNVTCLFDNGTEIVVGSKILSVPTTGDLSITKLSLTNSQLGRLKFSWDPVKVLDCPSIVYMIDATGSCGVCPSSVSTNAATCRDVRGGSNCTISIYADICLDRIWSESLTLITATSDISITNLAFTNTQLGKITFVWDQVNVNITDCPIVYVINTTSGCGVCPQNVSTNTVTCREVEGGGTCTFSVYADICYDRTNTSTIRVNSALELPNKGNVIGMIIAGVVAFVVLAIIIICLSLGTYFGAQRYRKRSQQVPIAREAGNGEMELRPPLDGQTQSESPSAHRPKLVNMFSKYSFDEGKIGPLGRGASKADLGQYTPIDFILAEDKDEESTLSCELHFNSEVTKCIVERIKPRKYQIGYVSQNRGVHWLHIKVDNEVYEGSPYKVVVGPSVETRGKPIKVIKGLKRPTGVALSKQGHVIVVEESNKCVSIYAPPYLNKCLRSFGCSRRKHEPGLVKPCGVAIIDEMILVVDCELHCILVFTFNGVYVQSIGQKGRGELEFNEPMGIGVHPDTHKIYITDFGNCRIQVLNRDLTFSTKFGSKGSGDMQFNKPWGVAFDSKGLMYVADAGNHRIQVFTVNGTVTFKLKFGQEGHNKGQLSWPSSLAIDRKNQLLYVTEDDNNRISVFTLTGDYVTSFGKKGKIEGEFILPHGIAVDEDGLDIFVADHHNNRLQIF